MKKTKTMLKFAKDTEGDWVALPLSMLMQTVFFGGYKGSGKTTAMKKLFEAAHEGGAQCVSIAPLGKWYSLRIAKNGKGRGLRGVVVFGGEYGDVPILPGSGRILARAVHTKKLHAVLDVELMRKDDRAEFLADFFEELMMLRKKGRHGSMVVFLDETQAVAPQMSTSKPIARLRALLGDFARECRNFGCGLIMSAQRSASVDKELIALCDMLIVMRTIHNLDRKAYEKWIDEKGGEDDDSFAWLRKLKKLTKGEAYLYAPEEGLFQRVRVEMIKTYDATATATIGARVARVGRLKALDVKRLSAELTVMVEKMAAEDPATLKAKIKELEMKLAARAISKVVTGAIIGAVSATKPNKKAERSVKASRKNLERYLAKLNKHTAAFAKIMVTLDKERDRMAQAQQVIASELANTRRALGLAEAPKPVTYVTHVNGEKLPTPKKVVSPVTKREFKNGAAEPGEPKPLTKGALEILGAIAQHPGGITTEHIAVLTGYKATSRRTYLQQLSANAFVMKAGELYSATTLGVQQLGDRHEALPTGPALRDHWLTKLPEGERRIFSAVVEAFPTHLRREEIEEKTAYKATSVRTYVQKLSARQLVVTSGDQVKAAETLFMETP